MNVAEPPINRDDVIAELDAQIRHATGARKGRRGRVRRSLMDWIISLEDASKAVAEGMTTEAQVRALVDRGCRLAGAFPAEQVGNRGLHTVWMTTSEDMAKKRRHRPASGTPAPNADQRRGFVAIATNRPPGNYDGAVNAMRSSRRRPSSWIRTRNSASAPAGTSSTASRTCPSSASIW